MASKATHRVRGNKGYPASLERRKIYVALRDADAGKHALIRIVDESGDDYLYPEALFARSRCLRPSGRRSWPPRSAEVLAPNGLAPG